MEWFEGMLLGLLQGLTEFLPVSSSGHLLIARELFGLDLPEGGHFLSFEVAVHAATALATIVAFRKPIARLFRGLFEFKFNDETSYVLKICLSMIPVFIVGVFFKDFVESLFNGMTTVGIALLVTAVLLTVAEFLSRRRTDAKEGISWLQAFIVGLFQAVAVIPGLSRSGATISSGLICGVRRDEIAQFSFLMVLVPILGEAFLDLVGGGFAESAAVTGVLPLCLGFASAFISGLFACKVMVAAVRRLSLLWFAVYCFLAGGAVLLYVNL